MGHSFHDLGKQGGGCSKLVPMYEEEPVEPKRLNGGQRFSTPSRSFCSPSNYEKPKRGASQDTEKWLDLLLRKILGHGGKEIVEKLLASHRRFNSYQSCPF